MQIDTFKKIINTFSDPGEDVLIEREKIIFSMNNSIIDIDITSDYGDIYVIDNGNKISASKWIVERLANLPLLSRRIINQIPEQKDFVTPSTEFLPSIEKKPDEIPIVDENGLCQLLSTLDEKTPLESSVVYLTSDAGEGKTSLINKAAIEQAHKFENNKSDFLLVPIVLGGRNFLRFDDITVGALQNKYRFPFLYYNSFLSLVRMGVIIPAFDGFEEMFVENSSGEALSAMGILLKSLESTGKVLIAARKAYFEFENLSSQEKLYDTISQFNVDFSKIEIKRWDENKFLSYCKIRKINHGKEIYDQVSSRLGKEHSLLTRPVLVRRLVDIAEHNTLTELIDKIKSSGSDFFSVFVKGIIEREANEKWLDRSGEVYSSLLTVEEHVELLSLVSINMWESRIEYLKQDYLDVVADYFCELKRKNPLHTHQIRERIRGHALLVLSNEVNSAVEFDHDEFRQFFLGEGLIRIFSQKNKDSIHEAFSILRRGILPEHTKLTFIRGIKRNSKQECIEVIDKLLKINKLDGQASYTKENCGSLVSGLLNGIDYGSNSINDIYFGVNQLADYSLINIKFIKSFISTNNYTNTKLKNCFFDECNFGKIIINNKTRFDDVVFNNCNFESLSIENENIEYWVPDEIKSKLSSLGGKFEEDVSVLDLNEEKEPGIIYIEKLVRYFMRSTHMGESVIKIKLGDGGANDFFENYIPNLLHLGIVVEIDNRGASVQRRFKLGKPLKEINIALSNSKGLYDNFIKHFDY